MASVGGFLVSPVGSVRCFTRHRFGVRAQSLEGGGSTVLSSESVNGSSSVVVGSQKNHNGGSLVKEETKVRLLGVEEKKKKGESEEGLAALWDDGYGRRSVEDYFAAAKEICRSDGGPPRWFCPVECGPPLKDSPTLLFLPGMDGTGLGLTLHHQALGKVFEVRCLHVPVHDRTPFEELVKLVGEAVKLEHALFPNKPIYLVGDSFGGSLALAVAAHNPTVDLVLILSNPATSFGQSQLQPLFPILEALPDELHVAVPFVLSFIMGDPVKMASVNIGNRLPPVKKVEQLSHNLTALLPCLPELANVIPRDTLLWKLKLLKSAAAYANSRLHAVKAEVLVLASGKDNLLPSVNEAKRLAGLLSNCKVRVFKDSGHTLLLEDGIGLLTIIRGTCMYRPSRRPDLVRDFIPPSMTEFRYAMDQVVGSFRSVTGSVFFSTLEDGKIVKGLSGVPEEGPVLYVGYHMLLGLELISLTDEFLSEKGIALRGIAHPELFMPKTESLSSEFSMFDWVKIFGGVPVSASNLFKLLSTKSHVLLYPGGAREALHYKGEEYKLIWPDHPEFVRMAARFGATIVPFGAVGEDDIAEMLLDYNDLMKIPIVNDSIREMNRDSIKFRSFHTALQKDMYKNRLQELAQRSCFNLPAYSCIREGPDHAPRFKATVNFNGETFESPTFCSTLRQAEHAAAEVALNTLAKRGPSRALAARVLDETGVYKNLLQETAHRAGLNLPVYTTIRSGPGHGPNFSCTVEIAGKHFTGDPARTKKQAQKNAAMAAWAALKKLSEHSLSSSFSPEARGNGEQDQVIIARILANGSKNFSQSDNQLGWQKSTTTSLVSTHPTADMYPTQCQHCVISSFSPEVALYQIWQQEQILQQQNRLLALTFQPIIPSSPHIYPLMQSMFQPDHCLYFPSELSSVPVGPKLSMATSSPSFCFSNQIGPELNAGRSTLTIREIQEEKTEDPPVCTFSNEIRVLPLGSDDESKKHDSSGSRSRTTEQGEQCEKSEWDSHWSMGSVHRPINSELQNPSRIGSSVLRSHSQANYNRSFRPRAPSSSSIVRTICPTQSVVSRPQHVASRLRTGIPQSPGTSAPERFGMMRSPTPLFMAPAVRIRSVVPVCSAPPRRSMAEEVSKSKEKEDLKPEDKDVSRTSSELGHLRI